MLKPTDAQKIVDTLDEVYPKPAPPLRHRNVFELLLAVILSAQCTDHRVNIVTQQLFPINEPCTPQHILELGESEVMRIIRPTGYYNSKTKAVMGTAAAIQELGEVPSSIEELTKLPGVGRKTAQVVQSQWFKIPAFPVDTHVHRLANRMGFCATKNNRDKTERALKAAVPKERWIDFHLQLIYHGRQICTAHKPKCSSCPVFEQCQWKEKTKHQTVPSSKQ